METTQNTKIINSFKKVALILSLLTISIGLLVEIGWQFDIKALQALFRGATFMNPLGAVSFILIGLSIQVIGQIKMHKFIWLAQLSGLFVILVGCLRLEAIIFGFDTRIDQFLFRSKILENRIAPNTALAFIFIGTALFFLAKDKYYKLIHTLCFFTAAFSLLAILGYAYSATNLYGFFALTPMALDTAVALLMSSLAILFVKPDKGLMWVFSADSSGGKTARMLMPAIIIIPSVLGKLILWAQNLRYINAEFGFAFLDALLTVIFLAVIYRIVGRLNKVDLDRQRTEEGKYQSDEKLKIANVALDQELIKYRSQNKNLDDAQKAMLNVLEDAKELQNELGKFKLAADSAYEHIIITDNKGTILYANKGAQRNTGYSVEEMIGKTTALWGGQMDENYYKQMWQTLTVKKSPFISDITNKRKNGERYIAQLNISPILDAKGDISFFVGLEDDITNERKLTEDLRQEKANVEKKVIERTKQLGEEQSRLQASINSLNSGFILTDTAQNILVINHVAQKLLCLTHDQHHTGTDDFHCTMHTIAASLQDFDLSGNIDRSIRENIKINVRDIKLGEAFLRVDISPIVMKQAERLEVIGAVVFVDDITEAKLVERSRDEFFSIASHELRTPLTAIRGNTSLIQQYYADELKDPNLGEMIEDIHESSVRLIEIVNDFLDSSRLEQNRITFQNEPFDLVKLADDVIRGYQVTSSRNMLHLHLEPPKQPIAPVLADKNRVKQVLINLVGNGLKFTDQGGVTIRLDSQAGFAKISVTDTGRGISPENQKLLFRKFQQAASSIITRDTTQGTGLGLYISKMIIEGMGGQIHLERSEMGKGSTFSFTLPLAGAQAPSPQTPSTPGAAGTPDAADAVKS